MSVCLEKLGLKHVNVIMFDRYFIFPVIFIFFSASMEGSSMRISKNKKKHTLVPWITSLVSKFQLIISILSIVCKQNKILEPWGKRCQSTTSTDYRVLGSTEGSQFSNLPKMTNKEQRKQFYRVGAVQSLVLLLEPK